MADDQLPAAASALQSAESVTDVAAAPAAGVLTHLAGAVAGITANAVSFAVSAALLTLIRRPAPRPARAPTDRASTDRAEGWWAEITAGLRVVARDRWLRSTATTAAVTNLVLTAVGTLQALFLRRTVGVPPGWFGLLLSGKGVGGVLGAVLAGWLTARVGSCRSVMILAVTGPAAGLLIAATTRGPRLGLFIAGTAGSTAAVVATNVVIAVFRQRYIPRALLGRVTAATRVVAYAAAPTGALAAGALAAAVGTRTALTAFLVLGLTRGLLFLRNPWRTTRDLPGPGHLDPPS